MKRIEIEITADKANEIMNTLEIMGNSEDGTMHIPNVTLECGVEIEKATVDNIVVSMKPRYQFYLVIEKK